MTASTKRVVLASSNRGKLAEINRIFGVFGLTGVAQSELGVESIEETGSNFIDNALLKARHAAAITGLPAIADDSGLAVDALGGEPGVRSARYAGEPSDDQKNIDKLLVALQDVPDAERGAQFHCAVVFVASATDPDPLIVDGVWRGRILRERRGQGGFGYDPVFLDEQSGRSAAELAPADKDRVSHRGQAMRALSNLLQSRLGVSG